MDNSGFQEAAQNIMCMSVCILVKEAYSVVHKCRPMRRSRHLLGFSMLSALHILLTLVCIFLNNFSKV